METATVSKETEVKEGKEVVNGVHKTGEPMSTKQPEEVKSQLSNLVGMNLEAAVKEAVEEIRHCAEQASLWLERKRQYQTKMSETLENIQKQFATSTDADKKASRTRIDKNATVPDLIRTFLEKNGPARTKDIRKFLRLTEERPIQVWPWAAW